MSKHCRPQTSPVWAHFPCQRAKPCSLLCCCSVCRASGRVYRATEMSRGQEVSVRSPSRACSSAQLPLGCWLATGLPGHHWTLAVDAASLKHRAVSAGKLQPLLSSPSQGGSLGAVLLHAEGAEPSWAFPFPATFAHSCAWEGVCKCQGQILVSLGPART